MGFFKTDHSWAGLILRIGLGGVIFAHGAQKLLGWFGGNGFDGTMGFLHKKWACRGLWLFSSSSESSSAALD